MRFRPSYALACAAIAVAACRTPAATPTAGQALYEQYCAVCHGSDGRSVAGMLSTPHLSHQGLLTVVSDEFLRENTARGRPGENGRGRPGTKMSAFGDRYGGPLTDAQIDEIVAHIRTWQTDPAVDLPPYSTTGDPERGRVLYTANCESCHGKDGWPPSNLAPALAGATFQDTASDAYIRHTILAGRLGTTMPQLKLSETQVDDLVAYIRTLE